MVLATRSSYEGLLADHSASDSYFCSRESVHHALSDVLRIVLTLAWPRLTNMPVNVGKASLSFPTGKPATRAIGDTALLSDGQRRGRPRRARDVAGRGPLDAALPERVLWQALAYTAFDPHAPTVPRLTQFPDGSLGLKSAATE